MHTVNNTLITTVTMFVLVVGPTFGGRHHDSKIFNIEFPTATAWFEHLRCLRDSGSQGIHKDYQGENRQRPFNRGRKSKNHPNPTLTDEQREFNREWSRRRVRLEPDISGMKRFNILVDRCRGRKPGLIDEVLVICAGFWNLNVIQNALRISGG
jgi:DDE superfamily endonuclease